MPPVTKEAVVTTLNGWSDVEKSRTTRIYVGRDKNGCTVRKGTEAAFAWLMQQIHERVEPVDVANGHRTRAENDFYKGARNSNHISGTAVDLNGGRHPYEAHQKGAWTSGFTAAQTAEIRKILAEAGGLFAWGADFPRGKRDAMHFELAKGTTMADVQAFVSKIEEDEDMQLSDEQMDKLADLVARKVWGYKNVKVEPTRDAYAILRSTKGDTEHLVKEGRK